MIKLEITADNPIDLHAQLRAVLLGSAPGLVGAGAPADEWQRARQIGFRQGFEAGLAENRPRPADYPPSAPEVAQQQYSNQAEANRKVAAEAAAQRANAHYPVSQPGTGDEPETPVGYASSPENVAKVLRAKHHDHIGPTD